MQYRGKCTEEYARPLHKLNAPCRIVMTLRKLKTVLPSLKPPVEKIMRSNVVYKITCPRCQSCYVGQTKRQLQRRFTEHLQKGPVKIHTAKCNVDRDPYCDISQTLMLNFLFLSSLDMIMLSSQRNLLNKSSLQ